MGIDVSGNRGLNFTATLSITEAKRNAQELKRVLADLGINTVTQSQKIFNQSQIEFQNQLRKARIELLALKKEEQELKNTNLQTGAATAELTNKIAANRLAQQELTKAAKAAKEAQKATAGSYKEATERLKVLGAEIRNTTGGFNKMTPELKAKVREYNELNSRLKAFDETMGIHTRKVGNYKSALDGLKGVLSTYISVTAVLSGIKAVVNNNAELSDSLSDVRRTAGLTSIEADNLAEQLKKIDTRTSLKGLLDIAIIGGQLGIAKDQLAGFTTAVDQLAVSLGGELQGGAQGIAKSLGVLDNVFGITKSNAGDVEKSFNQIGSAILGLGQSGLATGDFLADFGERVGGLAKQAGLSLPVILSYGAVLQENGVSAEVAGSAFKRLLSALTVNRSKFFAVAQLADANLTLNDFTNIINTDAKKALDLFFAGLAKGGTTTSSFNDILKSLKLTGAGVSQAVAALANGQDALNGHIKDATNDFNEATLSAEQYAIKNDNLAGSIQKLGNTFDKITTSGSISRFFKAIVDGSNYALQAVDDLFNKITQNGRTNALKNYNRTGKTGSIFFSEEDAKFLQQEAKAAAQKGYVEGLNDQGRAFAKTLAERANGEKELNNTITAQTAKLNSLERERNKLLKNRADFNGILAVQEKQLLNQTSANYGRQKAVVQELLKTRDKLYPGAKPESPNVVIDNKSQLAEARKLENALKAQRALQAEIDALTKKGSDKRQDDDARELAEVDAKYKKLREKAIAFNNDSRNKAKGLRVDSSGLLRAQSDEEDALRDKQNASNLKTTIDKEKKYYEDFEKFKSDFGLEKARERYGKLINVDQTYLENLKAKQAALLGDDKAKGGDAGGGEFVAKQQKVLEDATAEALQEEQKRTDALLKEFMSYADKRKNLTEQYNADIKALEANPGAQAERKKRYEKDIKELDAANATQLESYEKLFEGIEKLSVKSALQLVKTARKQLADQIKSGTIVDPEQIKLINKLFDTTEQTIREKNGQALKDLAGEVNNVASEVGALNAEFGKVLGTVGSVIGKIGEIKGFKEILKKDSSSDAQRQIAGLGILGAGFSIFQSVIGFFTKSEQREQQASYARDLQNKQTEALNKALERQVALLNDVYGTDRIKDYSSAINQARENQAKYASELVGRYQLTGDSQLDEFITKLNNGEKIDPTYNGMVAKAKKASSLLPSDINTLQRLLDEGKLDANTATIVTNLIKAKETAEQLVNNLRAETVGTTLDQIADDFITTLTDGTQDFGKTFEQTIQKSILNGFKGELIRKQLQTFYTQFAALSEGGLTSDEIETLRKAYIEASAKAKKDIEDLSKATGIDLTSKGGSDNSSVGVIQKNVTESTATEWIGLIRAQYDNQKRQLDVLTPVGKTIGDMYQIAKSNFDVQVKIEANTYRTANNTDLLNTKLDNIERAIKGSGSTSYDRGK